LIYSFYDKLNKFATKNISEKVSSSTLDTLRVSFFLLDEAIELMDSLFGLMLLGVFVNSNIFIQYDLHGIQTSVFNLFNEIDVEMSLSRIPVLMRWLIVTVVEIAMQFCICAKVEKEVSTLK